MQVLSLPFVAGLFGTFVVVCGTKGQFFGTNYCNSLTSCNECIGTEGCVWCTNHEFEAKGSISKQIPRCDSIENHVNRKDGFCGILEFLEIPYSSLTITRNTPLSQTSKIHISPQDALLKLAVGQPTSLSFEYLEDADKQLDLYYLLDLSYTMKENKISVAKESHRLAEELKRLTKGVRLGFGSFIDKPVMPFASYEQLTQEGKEVKPYGFKNHLALTDDISTFQRVVNGSTISANIDKAEGGFDAIMQSLTCNKQIGWRENTTKVLVMATDGPFHIAGDGKIGGIVLPNDMKCHLDDNGEYTHSTLLDYPSVGEINSLVRKSGTYIIFAVTEDCYDIYTQLSKRIDKSKVGKLSKNSDNVVDLVRNQYNSLKGNVQITVNGSTQLLDYIDIQYEAKCGSAGWMKSDACTGIDPGQRVEFRASITLKACPTEIRVGEIRFTTFDLREEGLRVKVNLACDCNCTVEPLLHDHDKLLLDKICNGNADRLMCGRCVCDAKHSGSNCECSIHGDPQFKLTNVTSCKPPGSSLECSGRGRCFCGQCNCPPPSWGQYCECDRSKCRVNPKREYERECSNQGKCICETCHCNDDRGGDKCQCPKNKRTCIEPGSLSTSLCSGQGECKCSSISVTSDQQDEAWEWSCTLCHPGFTGKYCHICRGSTCKSESKGTGRCRDQNLAQCISCHMMRHNETNDDCRRSCVKEVNKELHDISGYDVSLVSFLAEHETPTSITCEIKYNETCFVSFIFEYQSGEDSLFLKVAVGLSSIYCPPPINFLPIILYGAGGVVLVGILTLLLWKLFTYVHDTREFRRFEKERAEAKWTKHLNPLYSTPTSTFQNPAYRN